MVRLTSSQGADESEDESLCETSMFIGGGRPAGAERDSFGFRGPQSPMRAARFKKTWRFLDFLYGFHAFCALATGLLALIRPRVFHVFMHPLVKREGCESMDNIASTIIRLYGALILSQALLVWQTRQVPDPFVRKIFAQGYCMCFTLSSVVLAYSQLTSSEWGSYNWTVVALFTIFAAVYAWFLMTQKLPAFERSEAATL